MSDENVFPLRRNNPKGTNLVAAHNNAASQSPSLRHSKPTMPVSVSYTMNSAGFSTAPPPVTTKQPQTIPANDPRINAFKKIIGGMLYLERYDALEKLLSNPTMEELYYIPISDSKQSALAYLLNTNLYIHPGQTLSNANTTPNTRNAYLINELCSKLNDEPNETADKMQTHIRNLIRFLLNLDDIDCSREERYRQEKKPFFSIATSGNLEFVELFISCHRDLVPETYSDDGKDIIETLKRSYLPQKPSDQKQQATDRINAIVTMMTEATTQRNLKNGDFHRISPQQFIDLLMDESPVAIDPKSLPMASAPEGQKALPAPKDRKKPNKNKGLEPK